MLRAVALEQAVRERVGKALGAEDAVIVDMPNCPEPWKYELCSSINAAIQSCNPEQVMALPAAMARDIGLIKTEKE